MHRTNIRGTFVFSQQAAPRFRSVARSSTSPPRSTRLSAAVLRLVRRHQGRRRRHQPDPRLGAARPRRHRLRRRSWADRHRPLPLRLVDDVIDRPPKAPLERLGSPSTSPRSSPSSPGPSRWINGQSIYVYGGVSCPFLFSSFSFFFFFFLLFFSSPFPLSFSSLFFFSPSLFPFFFSSLFFSLFFFPFFFLSSPFLPFFSFPSLLFPSSLLFFFFLSFPLFSLLFLSFLSFSLPFLLFLPLLLPLFSFLFFSFSPFLFSSLLLLLLFFLPSLLSLFPSFSFSPCCYFLPPRTRPSPRAPRGSQPNALRDSPWQPRKPPARPNFFARVVRGITHPLPGGQYTGSGAESQRICSSRFLSSLRCAVVRRPRRLSNASDSTARPSVVA